MARRKNAPDLVRVKCDLADRLRQLRTELYGDRGGPDMARELGLPVRTWYNYEAGVTVPAEVILRVVELTAVEPVWLLHGTGPRFRAKDPFKGGPNALNDSPVETLLRAALLRLERGEISRRPQGVEPRVLSKAADDPETSGDDMLLIRVDAAATEPLTSASGPSYIAARREWLSAEQDCRCIRVAGDDMAPAVSDGAYVTYSAEEESPESLHDRLVVAWIEDKTLVRRYQNSGAFALLRADNPAATPATILVRLDEPNVVRKFRRVCWISTPH